MSDGFKKTGKGIDLDTFDGRWDWISSETFVHYDIIYVGKRYPRILNSINQIQPIQWRNMTLPAFHHSIHIADELSW